MLRIGEWARDVRASLSRLPDIEVKTIRFVGGATNVRVQTNFTSAPEAVLVAYVKNDDADLTITNAVTLHWRFHKGAVVLRDVAGLSTSTNYTLRLLVLGG